MTPSKSLGELMEIDARELIITIANNKPQQPAYISQISIKFCDQPEKQSTNSTVCVLTFITMEITLASLDQKQDSL